MKRQSLSLIVLIAALVLLTGPAGSWGRGMVSGRYLADSGSEIVLELTIGRPAPSSLILRQRLEPGTRVVEADPPFKKYDRQSGQVLWLFSGLEPGVITIRLRLQRPQQQSVSGEVRCLDPESGKYVTTPIP